MAQLGSESDLPDRGRYGHTMCGYHQHYLVMYGGQYEQAQDVRYGRNLDREVRMFDVKKQTWEVVKTPLVYNGITLRRDHAAAIMGNRMIVYGGIDKMGNYLSDVWEFNLVTK